MTSATPPTPPASAATASNSPPASATPVASRFPKSARWLAAVVAVVVLFFLVHWATYRLSHSITNDAFVEAHIVNVAPESVSGRIVQLLFEENDQVQLGQVLAEIEPTTYRDQVAQARGKLDLAEAELKMTEAGLVKLKKEVPLQIAIATQTLVAARADEARAQDSLTLTTDDVNKTIDEEQAAVAVASANLTLARQEYDRYTQLYKEDAVPLRRSQEVTQAHDSAKAALRLAEARLAKAEAGRIRINVAKSELDVARTLVQKAAKSLGLSETGYDLIRENELMVEVKREAVRDARIGLESAEHQLAFTKVRAPFPGVVVKRYHSLGDSVSAGVPILSMYNADLLYVTANLEETRLRGVEPGNPVTLSLDAFDRPFRGRVVWLNKSTGAEFALMPRNVVSGEFTKVVQRVPVRIWIEKDDRWAQLRSGLSVDVSIAHGPADPAWAESTARTLAEAEARFGQVARE